MLQVTRETDITNDGRALNLRENHGKYYIQVSQASLVATRLHAAARIVKVVLERNFEHRATIRLGCNNLSPSQSSSRRQFLVARAP